jgi:hypothetical protein
MRTSTLLVALIIAAAVAPGRRAEAQAPVATAAPTSPGAIWLTPRPYSYYAAYPDFAREYVGYGSNDFPFYGRPYGSPSDRWSWWNLRGDSGLARYYYPPVR